MANLSKIYLPSFDTTKWWYLQPRSENYKDLQPFGDVQNFVTMMNWWLQLQQVTPRRCIWNTRSSEANLGLACQTDPWSEYESIVILSGQSLIEKFMARLSQWSLNCQSWQHRAEACTELQLSRRKWTKSFRAALQNLWLDHNCPSKYTLSQEHGAQVSLWANLNACAPRSSTLPISLHPSLWESFVSKMHHL